LRVRNVVQANIIFPKTNILGAWPSRNRPERLRSTAQARAFPRTSRRDAGANAEIPNTTFLVRGVSSGWPVGIARTSNHIETRAPGDAPCSQGPFQSKRPTSSMIGASRGCSRESPGRVPKNLKFAPLFQEADRSAGEPHQWEGFTTSTSAQHFIQRHEFQNEPP